jgi:peptide/nickel transport system ATP-binding protein
VGTPGPDPRPERGAPLLEVESLTVALPTESGPRAAVDRVSFSIGRGEGVALVGESGSGKTQLARALLGLSPDAARVSGRVRFEGRELTALPDPAWARVRGPGIAAVFQEPAAALDPVRTVGEHLAEAIDLHRRAPRAEVRRASIEALTAAAFPDPESALEMYPHRLSGGLQQRAGIAIALAPAPRLLIADEPTASLDATVALEILTLIDRLRAERGLAVLLITHDLGIAARHADRVVVLYAGRIVEEASRAALFAAPKHPYTLALLRSAPRLAAPRRPGERFAVIPGAPPSLAARADRGCAFAPRCPDRFAPCAESEPELEALGGGRVRCFLHAAAERLRP